MSNILVVGQVVMERQFFVDNVAKINEVSFVRKINTLASSKELNASRILVKNNNVDYLACVGADADGEEAIKYLDDYGLNIDHLSSSNKSNTGQVVVMTDKSGASAITVFVGANDFITIHKVKIKKYDLVYTSTANPLDQIYDLIQMSKASNVPILVDFPNKQKEFDKDQLRNVSFVVPNRQEAGQIVDEKIMTIADALRVASKLKSLTDGTVIITLDKDGCVVFDKEWKQAEHFPTKRVNVVDMTASGDIFRGTFVDQFLKTKNVIKSVKKSLEVATQSCTIEGVDSSIKLSQSLI